MQIRNYTEFQYLSVTQIKLCTVIGAMGAMLGVNLVEAGEAPSAPDCPIDSAMPMNKICM